MTPARRRRDRFCASSASHAPLTGVERRDGADAGQDRQPATHPYAPLRREPDAGALLIALGFAASVAAAITPTDLVLEPSAGTGLLAILAELAGALLVLNELAESRAGLLRHLFPGRRRDKIRRGADRRPSRRGKWRRESRRRTPPFSALANVDRRVADAALRHISSALARLAEGGRLVAITGAGCAPDNPTWGPAFVRLQERGRIVFS